MLVGECQIAATAAAHKEAYGTGDSCKADWRLVLQLDMTVACELASVAAKASAIQRQRDMDMAVLVLYFPVFGSVVAAIHLCSLLSQLCLSVQQACLA